MGGCGGGVGVRMFTMIHCLAGDREAKKSILLWLMAWPPILSKTTKSNRLLSFSRYQLVAAFAFFSFLTEKRKRKNELGTTNGKNFV